MELHLHIELPVSRRSNSTRTLTVPVLVLFSVLLLHGCSKHSPSGPESIVANLLIIASYYYFPSGSPTGASGGPSVIVREGGETGPVVTGLTVTVNGSQLAFQQSLGLYGGPSLGLLPGQNATFRIADGIGAVEQTVQVPYAISGPRLLTGVWDTSDSGETNAIVWNNPIGGGGGILVYVYGYDGSSAHDLLHVEPRGSDDTNVMFYSWELAYSETIREVMACVGHFNEASFPGALSGSNLSAMTLSCASWPTSGGSSTESPGSE